MASCALRPFGLSQRHTKHRTTSATATAADGGGGGTVGGIGIGNGAIGRISSDFGFGLPCFGIWSSSSDELLHWEGGVRWVAAKPTLLT